jgi:hypothetical protein
LLYKEATIKFDNASAIQKKIASGVGGIANRFGDQAK